MTMPDAPLRPAIVLVDDEPLHLRLLQELVRECASDYDVLMVGYATAGLAHCTERSVPLVITDYVLPDMNGLELARAIRQVAPTTLIILITGYPTPELRRLALAAGVTAFVAKPFPLAQLQALITRALAAVTPPTTPPTLWPPPA